MNNDALLHVERIVTTRAPKRLTVFAVTNAKPGKRRREISDAGGPLRLVVQTSGTRSWAVRYRWKGQPKKLTLGPYPALALKDARELCAEALTTLRKGADPASVRRAERERKHKTVKALVTEYIEKHQKPRNRTWKEVEVYLDRALVTRLGARDVQDVTRSDLERLLNGRDRRTYAVVRAFWNWCLLRHEIDVSPAAAIRHTAPAVVRERVLSDEELRAFLSAIVEMGEPWRSVYELIALTAQRRSEVAEANWSEFDLDGALWTIPKERTKNGRTHLVPLAPRAVEILSQQPTRTKAGFVFPADRKGEYAVSGFSRAKMRLDALALSALKEMTGDPERVTLDRWRVHDLRRTGATRMAALGHPIHVVERVLNHVSGSTTGGLIAVYQRHDYLAERRVALDDWAGFLQGLKNEP